MILIYFLILHVQTGDFLFFFPGRKGKDEHLMTLQWNLSAISSTEAQDAIDQGMGTTQH